MIGPLFTGFVSVIKSFYAISLSLPPMNSFCVNSLQREHFIALHFKLVQSNSIPSRIYTYFNFSKVPFSAGNGPFQLICLRFLKAGILAILNSISTKKCNPPPIQPTIQVSPNKDCPAKVKVPKTAGYISQCVIARYKP